MDIYAPEITTYAGCLLVYLFALSKIAETNRCEPARAPVQAAAAHASIRTSFHMCGGPDELVKRLAVQIKHLTTSKRDN